MIKPINKKSIVLFIGFSIIAATAIMIVINLVRDVHNASSDAIEMAMIAPIYFSMVFPVILEELLLLRSIYKLIVLKPKRAAMICNIVAVCFVLSALVFQILANTHVITASIMPINPRAGAQSSRFAVTLILTEWTAILASFILGSIKSKNKNT